MPNVFLIPRLTADLSSVHGHIKERPEDFEVEEVPAYEPSGNGEHLFLWIEKKAQSAEELLRAVVRALDVPAGEIGSAGNKDRQAVTRQYLSVPRRCEPHLSRLDLVPGLRVLSAKTHPHKLRTGHLKGNRFRIVVRGSQAGDLALAQAIAGRLRQSGVPNFFGMQRFGRKGDTAELGLRYLNGALSAEDRGALRSPFMRRLALSALQSHVYNHYLAQRMREGLLHEVLLGDVMMKASGGIFRVADLESEKARFLARETIHAGPLFGVKTFSAEGVAKEREEVLISELGLALAIPPKLAKLMPGARRRNLVYVDDLEVKDGSDERDEAGSLVFSFSLPAGSYATVLLGEFLGDGDSSDLQA